MFARLVPQTPGRTDGWQSPKEGKSRQETALRSPLLVKSDFPTGESAAEFRLLLVPGRQSVTVWNHTFAAYHTECDTLKNADASNKKENNTIYTKKKRKKKGLDNSRWPKGRPHEEERNEKEGEKKDRLDLAPSLWGSNQENCLLITSNAASTINASAAPSADWGRHLHSKKKRSCDSTQALNFKPHPSGRLLYFPFLFCFIFILFFWKCSF